MYVLGGTRALAIHRGVKILTLYIVVVIGLLYSSRKLKSPYVHQSFAFVLSVLCFFLIYLFSR